MLFEKIAYSDDFPIKITIANIEEYPIHYHQDTEFVVVLDGEISLKNGCCSYVLKKGDIFTNSGHEVHRLIRTDKDNTVAVIQISTQYFSQYFPNITKGCYRTYTTKGNTKKHDTLREKLLHILLQYMVKSFNYKSECTYMMVDVIKYLDKYFNLFAFDQNMVINFESGNQITIDRISRIIGYIYEFHSNKITLEDLADMEHLSTFYISHIIKNCTGMSFRDFLSFARVEWSEIELLETNKKISKVARDVGFSTTAYYEKYFIKWFGMTPQTYREKNMPLVISDIRKGRLKPVDSNRIVNIIRSILSSLNSQETSDSVVSSVKIDIAVDTSIHSISSVDHYLDIQITVEDFKELGYSIFSYINELNPMKVTLLTSNSDSPSDVNRIKVMLTLAGFEVGLNDYDTPPAFMSYGYDSIAYPIFIFNKLLRSKDTWLKARLRDPGKKEKLLKGFPALITSNGIRKPAFYAFMALSLITGDIIYWGKQYCVIRTFRKGKYSFVIVAYNFNNNVYKSCVGTTTIQNLKNVLNEFKDEVDVSFNLTIEQGMYTVTKYSMPKTLGIFSYLATLDFPDKTGHLLDFPEAVSTQPAQEMYVEDVRATFNLNFSLKGAGIQLAVVSKKD